MPSQVQDSPLAATPSGTLPEIDARGAYARLEAHQATLIDVREPDEHARERIVMASLQPLSSFRAEHARPTQGQCTIIHCKSGRRSAEATRTALAGLPAGTPVYTLKGGIEAWKAAGLPTVCDERAPRISVMRQVQIVIGSLLLIASVLSWLVHPAFIGLAALLGAGLLFAGLSGTCGLALLLGAMPWNRLPAGPAPAPKSACCGSGSCACKG